MLRFRMLTGLAIIAFLALAVTAVWLLAVAFSNLPASLLLMAVFAVLGLAILTTALTAIGGLVTLALSFVAIEVRDSGAYGFRQTNWIGRKLHKSYQTKAGKTGFCQVFSWLSFLSGVTIFVVTVLVYACMLLLTTEEAITFGPWRETVIPLLYIMGALLFWWLVVRGLKAAGQRFAGTRIDRLHERTICPTFQTD